MSPCGQLLRVYTIGHSNVALDTVVQLLRSRSMGVVVDVRSAPRSRYVPHFDAAPLAEGLTRVGISYLPMGEELGGRPREHHFYDAEGHVFYGAVAGSATFQGGVQRLIKGVSAHRVAVLCSEEDPAGCHRHLLLARVLVDRGVDVLHLRHDGSSESYDDVESRTAGDTAQEALFDINEEPAWRSLRSVSPRSERQTSLEH
jgi:uncharacterized protein (DUF488 family)